MSYEPKPIETGHVALPPRLLELAERLAANTHDVWAKCRKGEGWRWGPFRDDVQLRHPSLVPYPQLPESERQVDRDTTLAVLKAVIALGWRIEGPGEGAAGAGERGGIGGPGSASANGTAATTPPPPSPAGPPSVAAEIDLRGVWRLWHGRDQETTLGPPGTYADLGERALRLGEPLLAYDVLREGLSVYPADARLRRLQALALARSGAAARAREILLKLEADGHTGEETQALLARTEKDLWLQSPTLSEGSRHLADAVTRYARSYRDGGGYWSGINVATLCACAGRDDEAAAVAREVREALCREVDAMPADADAYWQLATLGEAALVLGDAGEAEQWYRRASTAARGRYGDLAATRRNARLVLRHKRMDDALTDRWLPIPHVLLFSGHMVDESDRRTPRFPEALTDQIAAAVAARVKDLEAGFGYASASAGADVLFLEAMRDAGAETHVVLGCPREQFLADSAAYAGPAWLDRCRRAIDLATTVTVVSEQRPGRGAVSRNYANHMLHGLAAVRSLQLGTRLSALAVWDGRDGLGGTADNYRRWVAAGRHVDVIRLDDPNGLAAATAETVQAAGAAWPVPKKAPLAIGDSRAPVTSGPKRQNADGGAAATATAEELDGPPPPPPPADGSDVDEFDGQVLSVLFADAVGFSRLNEHEIPPFVRHFLGLVAQVASESKHRPVFENTWGDGLYFVFTSPREAGLFSMDLCDRVARTDWTAKGLPGTLNLRIGLHSGPVYGCLNPVTRRQDFVGTHVSRAARIEPVTPPGQVYASQSFAAVSAADGVTEFTCQYVGQMPLAKGYGTHPTFHVQRAPAAGTARSAAGSDN